MGDTLHEKLFALKRFRQNITPHNVEEIDRLLTEILSLLPEPYRIRFKALDLYEKYDDTNELTDLPF